MMEPWCVNFTALLIRGDSWVQIEVTDTGVGIPEEKLNTIFESFSQADASVTRRYGGTGLGLSLVKHILNRHRGRLLIESVPGHGASFTAGFPPASAHKDE